MAICEIDERNLDTLAMAFANYDIELIECQVAETGLVVPVICAINRGPNGNVQMVPFAELFRGDQYERLNPPRGDGEGFVTQAEIRGEFY